MAKAKLIEKKPKAPKKSVVLTLTLREAAIVKELANREADLELDSLWAALGNDNLGHALPEVSLTHVGGAAFHNYRIKVES